MKAYRLAAAGLALEPADGLRLSSGSALYTTSEPHSSKFWESEAAATCGRKTGRIWSTIC